MSNRPALLERIKNAVSLELLPVQGQTMSLADIESRLMQFDEQFQRLLAEAIDAEDKESCNTQFAEILAGCWSWFPCLNLLPRRCPR